VKFLFLFKVWLYCMIGVLVVVPVQAMQKMVVNVSVTDLRAEPTAIPASLTRGPALSRDIGQQETQLLFGEQLVGEGVSEQPGWLKVKALEQEIYTSSGTRVACPGYVKKSDVRVVEQFQSYNLVTQNLRVMVQEKPTHESVVLRTVFLGTKLVGKNHEHDWWQVELPDQQVGYVESKNVCELLEQPSENLDESRRMVVSAAKLCVKCPYVWGGRSYAGDNQEDFLMGLDCSGLVNLAYRAAGFQVPRNSHDQFLASNAVKSGSDLKSGDVVFLGRSGPRGMRMNHVLLYVGNGFLLEATGNPDGKGFSSVAQVPDSSLLTTRLISAQDYFGKPIEQINNHEDHVKGADGRTIFLGSFLTSPAAMEALRADELGRKISPL
jgi:cell wall-associated NlpC family hydrolase